MLGKLLDFVVGREPVATATGVAAVVTAALGVAASFGLGITPEQIAAVGALAAAVAGLLARGAVTPVAGPRERQEEGSVPLALVILLALAILITAGLATCGDALFEDEDEVNDLGITVTPARYSLMRGGLHPLEWGDEQWLRPAALEREGGLRPPGRMGAGERAHPGGADDRSSVPGETVRESRALGGGHPRRELPAGAAERTVSSWAPHDGDPHGWHSAWVPRVSQPAPTRSETIGLGLAYHEEDCWGDECAGGDYSQDYSSEDRNRNRGRNRGAFSPGPFEDSPVDFRDNCISLDCGGRERQEEPPA